MTDANPLTNPLAQPIKRPLPPPPPLTVKESVSSPKVATAVPAPAPNPTPAPVPTQFSVPTDEEIRLEEQREKLAAKPLAPAPAPAPVPAPVPVPAPAPVPAPVPTVLRPTEKIPTTPLRPMMAPTPMPAPIPTPPPAPTAPQPQPPMPRRSTDEMLDLGNEPPKRRWLLPTAIVAVLVLLGGTVWALQASGTIYVRALASLVGGIPKDPARALEVMQTTLAQHATYEYDSSVAITFGSKLPDVAATNDDTVSAEASGTVKGLVAADSASTTFEFTLGADYPVVTLKGKTVTEGETTNLYLDTLGLLQSNNSWKTLTASEVSSHALSWPLVMGDLYAVFAEATGGTYRGATVLQDAAKTPVQVYEYSLGSVINPQDASIEELRLIVWVSKQDGSVLVAKVDGLVETEAGTVIVQQQSVMSNYGSATPATLPEDAKPVASTVTELYRAFGIGGAPVTTTPPTQVPSGEVTPGPIIGTPAGNINDAKRLADLTSLKAALGQYKTDFGLYPLSKERSKSTDVDFVLKGSLVSKYLAAIPSDPSGGSNYYGYTSDGFSFTLTSILEDKTSPGAIAGNGYYYQEVKNN